MTVVNFPANFVYNGGNLAAIDNDYISDVSITKVFDTNFIAKRFIYSEATILASDSINNILDAGSIDYTKVDIAIGEIAVNKLVASGTDGWYLKTSGGSVTWATVAGAFVATATSDLDMDTYDINNCTDLYVTKIYPKSGTVTVYPQKTWIF